MPSHLPTVFAGLALALAGSTALAQSAADMPHQLPSSLQLPFEPTPALLARLREGRCWSEYRVYDPDAKVLGETLGLEWYDKDNNARIRLYLRSNSVQTAFRRLGVTYKDVSTGKTLKVTGGEGPDQVGDSWTAIYQVPGKAQGTAQMRVIEGGPGDDEHVSVGTLTLPGVLPQPLFVAHSAGCNRG